MKFRLNLLLLTVLFSLFVNNATAQKKVIDECQRLMALYSGFYNIKYYNEAYSPWQIALDECPEATKNLYIHGEKILHYKIKNSEDNQVLKEKYIDSLLALYDKRIIFFGQESFVSEKKGIALITYYPERTEDAYRCFLKSVNGEKENSDAAVIYNFVKLSLKMRKAEKINRTQLTSNYLLSRQLLQSKQDNTTDKSNIKRIKKIELAIERIPDLKNEINKNEIELSLKNQIENAPENLSLLRVSIKLLSDSYADSEVYSYSVEKLNSLFPSASTSRQVAKLAYIRKDYAKAEKYFEKAISLATNDLNKSLYYYEYGTLLYGQEKYNAASTAAKKSLKYNPKFGKALLLIGNTYVASSKTCGQDDFEQKAVYWAAIDKYENAIEIDSSVLFEAQKLITTYSAYFPDKDEAFFRNIIEGTIYEVGCWINEKTEARFVK